MKTLISVALILISISVPQKNKFISGDTSDNFFTEEIIEGKYHLVKYQLDEVEFIFREDRIEINGPESNNLDWGTFVFFEGSQKTKAFPQKLVGKKDVLIENRSFAKVMQSDYMTVRKYKEVIYSNYYPSVDLLVTTVSNGLKFELISSAKIKQDLILRTYSENELISTKDVIAFKEYPQLEILSSSTNKLKLDDGMVKFSNENKSQINNTSLIITLK